MKKGIIIYSKDELKNVQEDIEYMYFGSEYCIKRFLNGSFLMDGLSFCMENNKYFCLLSPFIPENDFNRVSELIEKLSVIEYPIEIVVNDYGLLYYINKFYKNRFDITLGRLLNRVKKAPSVFNYFSKLSEASNEALRISSCNNQYAASILIENGVKNIQYDNILQQNLILEDNKFQKHLMYPLVQISTSRKCIASALDKDITVVDDFCSGNCLSNHWYTLYNDVVKRDVILFGNTILYENILLPNDMEKFSRVIYNGLIGMKRNDI